MPSRQVQKPADKDEDWGPRHSSYGRGLIWFTALSLICFTLVLAWLILSKIETKTRQEIKITLDTTLKTIQEALYNWVSNQKSAVTHWALSPELLRLVKELQTVPRTSEDLLASSSLAKLRSLLQPAIGEMDFSGFFIITPDNISVGSMRDSNVGIRNLLADHEFFLSRVFDGNVLISQVLTSDVPLADASGELVADLPIMFVASPIPDGDSIIAVLAFQIDPAGHFTRITQLGRMGLTGETYAFDKKGKLITESRFDDQLRKIGLIPLGKQGILNVEIRDPGGNLVKGYRPTSPRQEQPLTHMANEAIAGRLGMNIEGYRDYRGVPVAGAWLWNEDLGFGLATEIDIAEAYQSLEITRGGMMLALALTVILAIGLSINLDVGRRRALDLAGKIRQSRTYLQAILENLGDGIVIINEQGIIETFNPAAAETFGYSPSEVIGQNIKILMPEHYHSELDGYIKNYLNTGQAKIVGIGREVLGKRKDGWVFPLDLAINEMWVGEERRFVGICRDITGRKQAEETLRKSKEETEKQYWLKTGLTELHDKMLGDQDGVTLTQNIITYLVERMNLQIGAIYLAENGALKLSSSYAYSKGKNLANEFKVGEGLVGQAALEKKSILVTDLPEDYIRIQSGLGEAPPRNILVTPFLYEGNVMGVIELGSVHAIPDVHMDFFNQALDDIAIHLNSAQSRTRQRELLLETQAQAEELTSQQEEMKQQQEELQQTNKNLGDQTKALEQQKKDIEKKNQMIEQKARELELASQYKSEFLANMSHELRTPLNSLLILSGLLEKNQEGNLTAKQVEFARTIHDSGSDLLNLINDIMDLAKVEAGKMDIQIEAMELASWVASMEQKFAPVAKEKGLYLKTERAADAPSHIRTDSWRLEQVIKNLMSNAFKFTAEGGVTLKIGRPESATVFMNLDLNSDNSVAISVSDTGKGISKEKQQDIFQAFHQEDGTIDRKYGGTGLGLSIARAMVKLLGGEIHLESKEGEGSVFTIYLLIKREAAIPARETVHEVDETVGMPAEAGAEEGAQAPLKGHNSIRVIEDDPRFNDILRGMAEECGFDCVAAEDGERGLELIKKYRPEGIILDMNLPGMDGLEVMKKLRDNPLTREIPIQIISAFDKRREAIDLGAIGYLNKPVTEEEIKSAFGKLDKAISQRNKKILVVEDDPVMRSSILEALNFKNVNVFEAATGREASKLLSSQPIDCMILDLGLPDMAGGDLLEEIKNKDHLKGIPVIIYTGKELTKDQERDLRKFSRSVIIKGIRSPERLIDKTRFLLFGVKNHLVFITGEKPDKPEGPNAETFAVEKILLVDDDMRNIFALTHSLENLNLSVVMAKNGKEGLEKLEANPDIQLVLMDIMMPEMDGFTAIKKIRKMKKYKHLPILALTAKAMKGDRQKCLDAGANDYLTKPVNIEELKSKLRAWLTGNK